MKRWRMMATLASLALVVATSSSYAQPMPMQDPFSPGNAGPTRGQEAYYPYYYYLVPQYVPIHDRSGRVVAYRLYYGASSNSSRSMPTPEYPNVTGLPSYPEIGTTPGLLRTYEEEDSMRHGSFVTHAHRNTAAIDVKVPANARLWFQDEETRQHGHQRFFESPPLKPGKKYAYQVKAKWLDKDGKKVERRQTIDVRGGAHVTLDLREPKP